MKIPYDFTIKKEKADEIISRASFSDLLINNEVLRAINPKHFNRTLLDIPFNWEILLLDLEIKYEYFFNNFIINEYRDKYRQAHFGIGYYEIDAYPYEKDFNYKLWLRYRNGYLVQCTTEKIIYGKSLFDNTLFDLLTKYNKTVKRYSNTYLINEIKEISVQKIELKQYKYGGVFAFGLLRAPRGKLTIETTINLDLFKND